MQRVEKTLAEIEKYLSFLAVVLTVIAVVVVAGNIHIRYFEYPYQIVKDYGKGGITVYIDDKECVITNIPKTKIALINSFNDLVEELKKNNYQIKGNGCNMFLEKYGEYVGKKELLGILATIGVITFFLGLFFIGTRIVTRTLEAYL